MNQPDDVVPPPLSAPAVAAEAAAAQDPIGWAVQAQPLDDALMSPASSRRALAEALGVDEPALETFKLTDLHSALSRLQRLVALRDQLAAEAATDDLTGAMRRGMGLAALQREIDRSRRPNGTGIVVGFFDVDGLKALNDSHGHAAGDRLLLDVVAAIRERIRSYDLVFRYGGDEFVSVLIDVDVAQAERTIADIRANVMARTGRHSISVGLAEVVDGDTAEAVVARADMALYGERRRTLTGKRRPRRSRSHAL